MVPLFSLSIASLGIGFFYRDFARIQLGPIFILEILFLLAALSLFLSEKSFSPTAIFKKFIPIYTLGIFFTYALASTGIELVRHGPPSLGLQRMLQNTLLFVYPFLWIAIGFWLATRIPWARNILAITMVLAAGLGAIFLEPNYLPKENLLFVRNNLSLGPLFCVPALWGAREFLRKRGQEYVWLFGLGAILCLLLAAMPIVLLWTTSMQRTSLVLILLFLGIIPFIIGANWKEKGALLAFGLGGFLSINLVHTLLQPSLNSEKMFAALNHSDDSPREGLDVDKNHFQGRFRAFAWKQALLDWQESPWLGIGFREPVPSMILPGQKNDGQHSVFRINPDGSVAENSPPVSGPHNSYLTILARTGVVGFILFLAAGIEWTWRSRRGFRLIRDDFSMLVLFVVTCAGLLHASFHIGFESPHNSVLLWLAAGLFLAHSNQISRKTPE